MQRLYEGILSQKPRIRNGLKAKNNISINRAGLFEAYYNPTRKRICPERRRPVPYAFVQSESEDISIQVDPQSRTDNGSIDIDIAVVE